MLKKLAMLPILASLVLIEALPAFAQQTQPPAAPLPPDGYWRGPMHMWNYGYGYGGHPWVMFPLMLLFIVLVCAVIFFLMRRTCGHGMHHWGPHGSMMDRPWGDPSHSALQILNERFARGEIQKTEFEEKKSAILSGGRR
jgi:putative membrane protein